MTEDNTNDAPVETPTFDALPLTEPVKRAIAEIGWENPTPVQLESYGPAIEGKDLLVQARTGTGKTAGFGIPIVDRLVSDEPGVQALILAPTRELALQSSREIERIGAHRHLRTVAIYGGAPMDPQVRALDDGAQIVSGTPGRVLDHLRRGTLDSSGLKVLVLDEADEMLSMGFARELHAILELLPEDKQVLLYSATVDDPIKRVAERHMKEPVEIELSSDAIGALGVDHFTFMVSGKARARDLIKIIEVENPESAIVFCNTKADTEQVASVLQQAGFNAAWLNGDLPQSEREKVMGRTRAGEVRFLVATDVAARGIDISHLTHVINYELPSHLEQYVHRTGRTGRAGRTGTALSLVAPQELGQLYYLRLTYKIFPVERSLPTSGEEQTRRELDRIELLAESVGQRVPEQDLALAKRLLTHPDAEDIIGGLLAQFFGHLDEPDEEAAAARRERKPAPVEEEVEAAPKRERPRQQRQSENGERRPRHRNRDDEEGERRSRRRDRDDEEDEGHTRLYVSVGKRDGIRVGDLHRLFVERGELESDAVGRIRLRDKHSFVSVTTEVAEDVVDRLDGTEFAERELKVELSKSN